jgi:hypothetical protein
MMISKRVAPEVLKDEGTVNTRKYARFFWPILRAIALIVALGALIEALSELLYGEKWGIALPVFMLATYVLIAMTPEPERLPAMKGQATEKARQHRLPDWSLIVYCVITGLAFNWCCVFLWFSRKYAFFSVPVVGVTGLILALSAAIGLLVARLTGYNWRSALLLFAIAPGVLASIVLRWGLLH